MNKKEITAVLSACLSGIAAFAQIFIPPVIAPPQITAAEASEPMEIKTMDVKAGVRGLYATVETTLEFFNPNKGRDLEGELVFPLPDKATVCGYALDINGAMVYGVVVPKEKARVAFETETRRRVDPGLVEHVKGNVYKTRIYPLPASGTRKIRLVYTSPLAIAPNGDAALFLPMPREKIGSRTVSIEVLVPGTKPPVVGGLGDARFEKAENFWRVSKTETDIKPGEDVLVALPELPESFAVSEKAANGSIMFCASVMAPKPVLREPPAFPGAVEILWDASGSRSADSAAQELAVIEAFPDSVKYSLIVFRDAPEASREFASKGELLSALRGVVYDGGTDFEALSKALDAEKSDGKNSVRLLFSDGLDTLSGKAFSFNGKPPTAIVSAQIADRETLRQACGGALVDLQTMTVADAVRAIFDPPPRLAAISGSGIADVQGIGQTAVGRVTVLGRLTSESAEIKFNFNGENGESAPVMVKAADAAEGKQLATAWASARVTQLTPSADDFADELLALGREYGLVSPVTSLIVLENLDQWLRHKIEPPATLPQMRDQWLAEMKRRGSDDSGKVTRHIDRIAELWKNHLEWWKRDYSKNPIPEKPAPVARVNYARAPESAPNAMASVAEEADLMVMEDRAERNAAVPRMAGMAMSAPMKKDKSNSSDRGTAIAIKAWSPDTPYLRALKSAEKEDVYSKAYIEQRKEWAESPAFFLDCAGFFFEKGDKTIALRVLSNLAELKIEDAALLRVFAWRLKEAGEYDRAIMILRRVIKLRGEDPQSYRDLALVLTEYGKKMKSKAALDEAMKLYVKVATTPWERHPDSISLFALEELNALIAWSAAQEWKAGEAPSAPDYDERLKGAIDVDVRIIMSWDADATDIDLHVFEPTGEEAFYGHNRTTKGGYVSHDITDGYGPEEYMIRKAPLGAYKIKAKYYASHQQTVTGPATVTATIYTDWGRKDEEQRTMSLRLDKQKDMEEIGTITFGDASGTATAADFSKLQAGADEAQVLKVCGEPSGKNADGWTYISGKRTMLIVFGKDAKVLKVIEKLPGGIENVIVQ